MQLLKVLGILALAAAVLVGVWMAFGAPIVLRAHEVEVHQQNLEQFREKAKDVEDRVKSRADDLEKQVSP